MFRGILLVDGDLVLSEEAVDVWDVGLYVGVGSEDDFAVGFAGGGDVAVVWGGEVKGVVSGAADGTGAGEFCRLSFSTALPGSLMVSYRF